MLFLIILQGLPADLQADADAGFVVLAGNGLDGADLAGPLHVGAAAGAHVGAWNGDDAHLSLQLLFAAVVQRIQLFGGRVRGQDLKIVKHRPVGKPLHPGDICFRQHTGKIHGDAVLTHMEADVVIAEAPVDDAGKNMLPGVLLHETLPALPVQRAVDITSRRKGPVAEMDDLLPFLLHIQHPRFPEASLIRRLAASLRIEGRPVQNHREALLFFPALSHLRVKFPAVCVLIIQSFRHFRPVLS